MHQRNHGCKAIIYTAANIFQRLDILARDVIELEKQYVCTYKAYPKSRTSTLVHWLLQILISMINKFILIIIQIIIITIYFKYTNHINFWNIPIDILGRVDTLFDGDGLLSQENDVVANEYTNNNNNGCNNIQVKDNNSIIREDDDNDTNSIQN